MKSLCLCLVLCGCSNFSTQDNAFQIVSQSLLVADWAQTLDIQNHSDQHESNVLLGRHPSDAKVDAYFAGSMVANQLIANKLEGGWRTGFQCAIILIETAAVSNNHALGIKLSF